MRCKLYNKVMGKAVLVQYLTWQFIDSPIEVLRAWRNFLVFNMDYFSIPVLLKTYFSHWHRYHYSYGKRWEPWRYLETFVFNMMSRVIGAVLRTVFIIIGTAVEVIIVFAGLAVFLAWLAMPFLLVFSFIFGVKLVIF